MRALVTGASRGIGAAVARRLATEGHDVVVHYHQDQKGADATAEAVRAIGRQATVVQADLGGDHAALQGHGPLDVVVHNGGMYDRRPFAEMDATAWRRTMAVDLDGPALLTHVLLPELAPDARLVFVSSIAARRGSAHGAHYAAAKAGLEALARSLATELAPRRVNAVRPGYIATDILASDPPQKTRQREQEVPLGRIGYPEDVAGAVAFLAGPDSAYITGAVLEVTGGI